MRLFYMRRRRFFMHSQKWPDNGPTSEFLDATTTVRTGISSRIDWEGSRGRKRALRGPIFENARGAEFFYICADPGFLYMRTPEKHI